MSENVIAPMLARIHAFGNRKILYVVCAVHDGLENGGVGDAFGAE